MLGWMGEKSDLQTQAEKLGLVSHDILHQSSQSRQGVEEQRRMIFTLASQLRGDVEKAKELKDALDDARAKVALIDTLASELEANHKQAQQLQRNITEQKQILRAVRISAQAKRLIDEIGEQTDDLLKAKADAQLQVDTVSKEADAMLLKEEELKGRLQQAQTVFKNEQMGLLVIESELRELQSEFERVKRLAIVEGRRNVELQKSIREERIDATVRYLATHEKDIHRVDRVRSTLLNIRQQMRDRSIPKLPPLKQGRKSTSVLAGT
jgi:hypothetical protein